MDSLIAENYTPALPAADWEQIRDFVLDTFHAVEGRVPYPADFIMYTLTHHVDWCVHTIGLPMTREALFRRDVIGAAVQAETTHQVSSQGRRRSLLLRVGETLGAIPVLQALPSLPGASPSAPYTAADEPEIYRWAMGQPGDRALSARALVALGLGAGLPPREVVTVRGSDVLDSGERLRVRGPGARIVPILDDWAAELAAVACAAPELDAPLFRPGIVWTKNIVTIFVDRSRGSGLRPSAQRMRATWLVHHLSVGTPMQDLLYMAGLRSMDALVRYERYLPQASLVS